MGKTPVDYDLFAIFVAVADESSFTRAARKLGIGKGTVSRAIAALEESAGAELVHRTTHQVSLSTAGIALYERTAPHLVALGVALSKLPERAELPSGELRLTAPHDFGAIWLPELLAQFSLRCPQVTFDVRLTNARVDLVAEGFDLAIRVASSQLKDSTLTARRLGAIAMAYYAAPSYLARRGEPRGFGDLRHDWAVFPPMLRGAPKGFRPRIRSDDFLLLRELLREGAGVGPLPTFVAEPYAASGRLKLVLPGERRRVGAYFLVYPSSGPVPRKVTAFRDFAVERVKTRPLDAGW